MAMMMGQFMKLRLSLTREREVGRCSTWWSGWATARWTTPGNLRKTLNARKRSRSSRVKREQTSLPSLPLMAANVARSLFWLSTWSSTSPGVLHEYLTYLEISLTILLYLGNFHKFQWHLIPWKIAMILMFQKHYPWLKDVQDKIQKWSSWELQYGVDH